VSPPRFALCVPGMFDARVSGPGRFRRLPPEVARASQPSCLRLLHASNASNRFGSSCSALTAVRSGFLASADFCSPLDAPRDAPSSRQMSRSPGVRRMTFAPYTRRIYARSVRVTSGFGYLRPLAHRRSPRMRFVFLGPGLCLRLPSHPHRCAAVAVRLGVPVTKVPGGLAPPGHFPSGFRLAVISAPRGASAPCPAHKAASAGGEPGARVALALLAGSDACVEHQRQHAVVDGEGVRRGAGGADGVDREGSVATPIHRRSRSRSPYPAGGPRHSMARQPGPRREPFRRGVAYRLRPGDPRRDRDRPRAETP